MWVRQSKKPEVGDMIQFGGTFRVGQLIGPRVVLFDGDKEGRPIPNSQSYWAVTKM